MKHTPGIWKAVDGVIWAGDFILFVLADCTVNGVAISDDEKLANARHLVACVNRLSDFCTEDIEDKTIDLFGAIHWQNKATAAEQKYVASQFLFNKLLSALQEIKDYAIKYPYDNGLHSHALEVIAKCEKPAS